MSPRRADWTEQCRRALGAGLDDLRARLEAKAAGITRLPAAVIGPEDSALTRIIRKFHLSPFERDIVLLSAGVEVDSRVAEVVGQWHGGAARCRPTFSQALSLLDQPHWSAMAPDAVLRRGRLIRLMDAPGLVDAAIVIEESVLHALNGLTGLDERLRPYLSVPDGGPLVPSQEQAASRIAEIWSRSPAHARRLKVLVRTSDPQVAADVFAAACRQLGLSPFAVDLAALPLDRAQLEDLLSLWERDAVLHDFALFVDAAASELTERRGLLSWMLDRLSGFVVIAGERVPASQRRATVSVALGEITPGEQAAVWQTALGPLAAALEGQLGRLTEQFRLPVRAIVEAAAELRATPDAEPVELGQRAWDICRRQARGGLDDLAQRLEPRAAWDRLVLPGPQIELLRSIAMQTRHRFQVYERWGFRARSSRGFGVPKYTQLFRELDLIVRNNQTPKPTC